MSSFHQVLILWALVFGACGFALWKGGPPERLGAILFLAVAILSAVVQATVPEPTRSMVVLLIDALLGVGFLLAAVRYASLWLGGVLVFHGVQFSLHAFYFVTKRPHDLLHAVVNNVDVFGALVGLFSGTAATLWRTNRAARRAASVAPTSP